MEGARPGGLEVRRINERLGDRALALALTLTCEARNHFRASAAFARYQA
ncbi:MAG: hypothetical protein RIR32_546 [Verrucomicrobiota bacterium]|jgi:hypothetical protein